MLDINLIVFKLFLMCFQASVEMLLHVDVLHFPEKGPTV